MRYTRQELEAKSIQSLQAIDIRDMDEEKLVQEILNLKLAASPLQNPSSARSFETDGITPEKEKELQEKIDAKNESKKIKVEPSEETIETPVDVLEEKVIEETQVVEESAGVDVPPTVVEYKKPFCDKCDSKAVRHRANCPNRTF